MSQGTSKAPARLDGILRALFAGRLRQQLHADIKTLGGDDLAARMISSGYVCLAAAVGWLITAAVLFPSGNHTAAITLAALSAAGSLAGYVAVRLRKDPRPVIAASLVLSASACLYFGIQAMSPIYAVLISTPAIASMAMMFRNSAIRILGVVLAAGSIVFLGVFSSSGGIFLWGDPSGVFAELASLSTVQALLTGTGTAIVSNVSREYALEQLRAANAELQVTSQRSEMALDVARVGLWEISESPLNRKITLTPSFTAITGYESKDLTELGDQLTSLIHPDDVPGVLEVVNAAREMRARIRLDLRIKTRDRGYRWFALRARHFDSQDGELAISGSLQDIQFMKAAEDALRQGRDRALEADRAKSDFIAVMSHEVRTPLNAILGAVSVLKRSRQPKETLELLNLADEAGQGLLSVANDLLDMSRLEAGKLDIELSPADIHAVVGRCMESWRPQAELKGLALRLDATGRASPPVRVDAARIRQIVGNLVSNAIKYTQSGEVRVSLTVAPSGADAVQITVDVSDTGKGVSTALSSQLFQPFERGRDLSSGGAGLGLYISRNLARLMGGDLTLESTGENGSIFRFKLRAELSGAAQPLAPDPLEADPDWAGFQVLIVDDNEANRRIAALVLAQFGATPVLSPSGEDALVRCQAERFDAILMDIVMPGLDGIETFTKLRKTPGSNQRTPVIALTARLANEDLARYETAGFDGVVAKPLDISALAVTLSPFLRAARARVA